MKKLFGRDKPKPARATPGTRDIDQPDQPYLPPPTAAHHRRPVRRSSEDERWELVRQSQLLDDFTSPHAPALAPSRQSSHGSLPPGASPPAADPRSPSPFSVRSLAGAVSVVSPPVGPKDPTRKQPHTHGGTVATLRALDPTADDLTTQSEHSHTTPKEPEKKRGFHLFGDRAKDAKREDEGELTRMIGYLTATASEDWALVLEVCERASSSDALAKEAIRALKREFKYGEPAAQLAAARLWAILLRNSSETFIAQTTSRKFLESLEDVLTSPRTSPVVRERLLDVVAAAAYASGRAKDGKNDGFRGLWRKVKPADKPDEGVPLDSEDVMFTPPAPGRRGSQFGIPAAYEAAPPPEHGSPPSPPQEHHKKHKTPSHNRIIPPEEDMRRLFTECKIGQGNASLLSQALMMRKPEDMKTDIIKEFYVKCRASQELIFAQIPWASSNAERSRVQKEQDRSQQRRTRKDSRASTLESAETQPNEQTVEERLLAALLAANGELVEALNQYDDMKRIAQERKVEKRSRQETKMDRQTLQHMDSESSIPPALYSGASRSRTPSPMRQERQERRISSRPSSIALHSESLAPPPAAPHGPRSPSIQHHSRTPSPATPPHMNAAATGSSTYGQPKNVLDGFSSLSLGRHPSTATEGGDSIAIVVEPSEKALGKRRVEEPEASENTQNDDDEWEHSSDLYVRKDEEEEEEPSSDRPWKQPVHYVYDAVAERRAEQQRIAEQLKTGNVLVNGVR
ncbi:hypothetical protein BD626DRAFT_482304 [Schizophyllum amplum]|uniref:VHS domain-containing protein n=1 Tax=Schizophyllum amplum TaxID=97359 RepID=A0A550CV08_9AGAR|nr:hypothetical protein BD626DRAFT_482304 [Auriculariopsis ampla]